MIFRTSRTETALAFAMAAALLSLMASSQAAIASSTGNDLGEAGNEFNQGMTDGKGAGANEFGIVVSNISLLAARCF